MRERMWITIPEDVTLSKMDGWTSLGDHRYSALRSHILIVGRRDKHTKTGPSFIEREIPSRASYNWTTKKISTVKYSSTIQDSIKTVITAKVSEEISSKIASEAGLSAATISTKLQSEIQAKSGREIAETLERELSHTISYEVQNAEEITNSITLGPASGSGGNGKSLNLYFFLKLWPWRWDVYLYKAEYLQLEYKSRWFWWQVRNTIIKAEADPKLPLSQITYYEPQEDDPSLRENSYEPEVPDTTIVVGPPSSNPAPNLNFKPSSTLEDLARIAFPVTKEEISTAKKKRAGGGTKSGPKGSRGLTKGASKGGAKGSAKGAAKGGSKSASKGGAKGGSKGRAR